MVNRYLLPSDGTNNALTLRGQFILPHLTEQGMQAGIGRGKINNVIPLTNELIVVCSSSGAALWNSINDEILWEIDNPATNGVLNFDATLLALSWNQYIYLWDLATGQLLRRLEGHSGDVLSIAMSPAPDSKLLASVAEKENIIRLWDVVSGQEIRQLKGHFDQINNLAFSPDGKRLACWRQRLDSKFVGGGIGAIITATRKWDF